SNAKRCWQEGRPIPVRGDAVMIDLRPSVSLPNPPRARRGKSKTAGVFAVIAGDPTHPPSTLERGQQTHQSSRGGGMTTTPHADTPPIPAKERFATKRGRGRRP